MAMTLSDSKEAALLSLMDRTGYNIIQENGQRKFGPPPNWHGPPPPKGCEVFVGKIPRDLYEDELVPVFEKIGIIYEVRLMMDFSGSNRGYAFVMYTNGMDAKRAVQELNNYEIRRNRFIGVCKSVDNCRLFVGGIPKNKNKEEILREMRRVTEDVSDVILYSSFQDKTKNRGFAFVEYENHRAAAMARRKLIPGKILLWGQEIAVDWAEPEPEVDENTMSKVTILYVRNLTTETTEEDLMTIFSLGNAVQVDKVKKLRDFAFVHYAIREDAERSLVHLNGAIIDNSVIEVTWAKPVDRANRRRSRLADQSSKELNSSVSSLNGQLPSIDSLTSNFSNLLNPMGLSSGSMQKSPALPFLRNPTSILSCVRNQNFPGLHSPIGSEHSSRYRSRGPIQMLQEICHKNFWGDPIYLMYSYGNNNSDDQKLHLCKVAIPSLCDQEQHCFSPDKLCHLPEEARLIAAEHTLKELGMYLDLNGSQPYMPSPAISLDHGQGDMGNVGNLFLSHPCTANPSGLSPSQTSLMKQTMESSRFFDLQ